MNTYKNFISARSFATSTSTHRYSLLKQPLLKTAISHLIGYLPPCHFKISWNGGNLAYI